MKNETINLLQRLKDSFHNMRQFKAELFVKNEIEFIKMGVNAPGTDTPLCNKCNSRTALVKGVWNYDPDSEPYINGKQEKANTGSSDAYLCGFKCDECNHVQDIWDEGY
jgi:hypothetical protein